MAKHLIATTCLVLAAAAWSGPGRAATTNYSLLTTITVPVSAANSQGGKFNSFDISYVDPLTGYYYVADRSNASVDIVNGATNRVVAQAGGFVGQQATTSISGPDGVVVVNNGGAVTLYAGDGGSALRSFNVTDPANPIALGTVNTGGGAFRVDEMAYSPATSQIFAANNANSPAYASLISATPPTPSLTATNITVPNQIPSGGLEQSVWNPVTGTFFVSVPTFTGSDAGGVQEFSTNGTALRSYKFSAFGITTCSAAGLTLGASGNLVVGCGTAGSQTVVLNPAGSGSIVAQLGAVSGSDELWYDGANGNHYVTGSNTAGDRVIDVFSDSGYALLQSIDLTAAGFGKSNLHSVAVDPLDDEIFVPITASSETFPNTGCVNGCIAVFAQTQSVPEPGSATLVLTALAGTLGILALRRPRGQTKAT
ncbi:MAG: hypothetical protein ACRYG8_07365 [Janthinobacterium lividum]